MTDQFTRRQRQAGKSIAGLIVFLMVLAVIVVAIWRFAPDLIPESVRAQLPRSPLDLSEAGVGGGADLSAAQRDASVASTPGLNPPLYKWQDASGVWNITDKPPAGRPYEKVVVNPDTNIMPAEPAPPAEPPIQQ